MSRSPKLNKKEEVVNEDESDSSCSSYSESRKEKARSAPTPKKWSKNKFEPLWEVEDPEAKNILIEAAVKSEFPSHAERNDEAFSKKGFC